MKSNDTYSLTEKGEKFNTPQALFEKVNGISPKIGDSITCHVHSAIMGKSFLTTLDVVK